MQKDNSRQVLKRLIDLIGKRPVDVARESGVKQSTLSRILGGKIGHPTDRPISTLAEYFGLTSDQVRGRVEIDYREVARRFGLGVGAGQSEAADLNVEKAPEPTRHYRYPVISRVQAGDWTEVVAPYPSGAEEEYEITDHKAKGRAFWLRVNGDSMTAPQGVTPTIPEGTLVLFDPGIEAVPGDLVAACLDGENGATFKKLIEDGGRRYLKALNPTYPMLEINGNCRIVGVAIEARMKLRRW